MILKHSAEIDALNLDKEGFSKMKAKFLLTAAEGCSNYALRLMEIDPGGYTSYHCHQEEHEMFFIQGQGLAIGEDKKEILVSEGDALYILPGEHHQLLNPGEITLKLICTVPILPGKNGKNTTPCE